MKKILFILQKKYLLPHRNWVNWIEDCKDIYNIEIWGKDINDGDISIVSLKKKIDKFKPDYIYLTDRMTYEEWLPDLTSIKIPKIFVECDNYYYNVNDLWYKQFDKLYCRQPVWEFKYSKELIIEDFKNKKEKTEWYFKNYKKNIENSKTWKDIPLFRWSVPEKAFMFRKKYKKGVYFVGSIPLKQIEPYSPRKKMRDVFKRNNNIIFTKAKRDNYWKLLGSASALVCPTESDYGDFIPTKVFEYAASGAAVLTNCNLVSYNMSDLDKVVIHYTDLKDLEEKLKMDFTPYYGKARGVIKNHTHKIRYKELFSD